MRLSNIAICMTARNANISYAGGKLTLESGTGFLLLEDGFYLLLE